MLVISCPGKSGRASSGLVVLVHLNRNRRTPLLLQQHSKGQRTDRRWRRCGAPPPQNATLFSEFVLGGVVRSARHARAERFRLSIDLHRDRESVRRLPGPSATLPRLKAAPCTPCAKRWRVGFFGKNGFHEQKCFCNILGASKLLCAAARDRKSSSRFRP